ncbi:DUF1800 domain-containing protein [Colwellia sp. PAMC 21821]|uniref:DUF1800 domain-containing protein n=1 Tax=Colwellia sp. PAMC 21821 TaxID=1816219 RepID=UPI0009BCFD1E|nr:DUF1800 domain-containing protein [Colwellia sp. PAMC 21821]ARD46034.1 hypothetical protein A3Q33_18105 [Colwellia sp. PAMC 21821]
MFDTVTSSVKTNNAFIALNRFGYGAKEGELNQAVKNPKQWIIEQLQPIAFDNRLPHSNDIFLDHEKYIKEKKHLKKQNNANQKSNSMLNNMARTNMRLMSADTINKAITSSNSVSWRLLDFFSNHFSVTGNSRLMSGLSSTLEREAIAPNLLGKFEDLLLAVEQHPAMLIYLNNERSFGPNSTISKKRNKGLNENLAREILELHTLGVKSSYTQFDVIELAKGISGWSVFNPSKERSVGFTFRSNGHEPGIRKLLGISYPSGGIAQGEQMLRDIAVNPATAKHVCYKLAHHFVSETPSKKLLNIMENTWKHSGGNIKQVMVSLFNSDEAWLDTPQKFKTPREFVISAFRALGTIPPKDKMLLDSMATLGQKPFNAGSPAGYSDSENDWLGASALMARIDWSVKLSSFRSKINAEEIMHIALALPPTTHTYKSVIRAESRQQALTLLLMSPEFQRR